MAKTQSQERQECLDRILQSKATKKIIVAGPGTGKTYTFGQLLRTNPEGNNIAMTFLRGLVNDMASQLADYAEVRTFHSYCKKILHEQFGGVIMAPYLESIIESDAVCFDLGFDEFLSKFQRLEVETPETRFFLSRGDYYRAVSFDDSVYRVYVKARASGDVLPEFDQIVIDEFQDFNALECAFISLLEERGSILLVGDDDQAVYHNRNASPKFLRDKYNSGDYEIFELPFCSRCTETIVESTNAFVLKAQQNGNLAGRIPRRFECFMEGKVEDNIKFPRLILGQIKVASTYVAYVRRVIEALSEEEIADSTRKGEEYPTVLVIGSKRYLQIIHKGLKNLFPQIVYEPFKKQVVDIVEGYQLLMTDEESNLGWRVIAQISMDTEELTTAVRATQSGEKLIDILPRSFVEAHKVVLAILMKLQSGHAVTGEEKAKLATSLQGKCERVIEHFTPPDKEEDQEVDRFKPTILLKSFVGSKGLSGGRVILVGMHNGDDGLPNKLNDVKDFEIAQFMVAMTRTRKQCHVLSNMRTTFKNRGGQLTPKLEPSVFLKWLPSEWYSDLGLMNAEEVRSLSWD